MALRVMTNRGPLLIVLGMVASGCAGAYKAIHLNNYDDFDPDFPELNDNSVPCPEPSQAKTGED